MNLQELALHLKLPYIKTHSKELFDEAAHLNMSYEEFLLEYLKREHTLRTNNGIKNRLRQAKFPVKKFLEDFDRSKYDREFRAKFDQLETLSFIKDNENIILIGTPGAGKTHYAIALSIKAIMEGKSVLFISVPNLVIELKEALSQNQLSTYKRRFEKYDIVVLDELGYVSFDKSGAEILFNLLSNRNEKAPIIITSNLSFERWNEVFHDTILTAALVDRLAHKAHILDISRDTSYRFEETMTWMKNENEKK